MRTPQASGRRPCCRHWLSAIAVALPSVGRHDGIGAPAVAGHVEAERAARRVGRRHHLAGLVLVAAAAVAERGVDGVVARLALPHHRAGPALAEGQRAPGGREPGLAQHDELAHGHVARRRAPDIGLPLADRLAGLVGHSAADLGDLVVEVVEPLLHLADDGGVGQSGAGVAGRLVGLRRGVVRRASAGAGPAAAAARRRRARARSGAAAPHRRRRRADRPRGRP